MNKILLALLALHFLKACVSPSEHEMVIAEKNAILQERNALKQELEDIKYGAPTLLSEGKKFYEARDFTQARQKFQALVIKHPHLPESIPAKKYLSTIDEEESWDNASSSEDITISENYIKSYPRGKYIAKANARRAELKIVNMQKAYANASNENSVDAWRNFLAEYPDHSEASAIKKKIIRLEVDEISGNRETGTLPTFNQSDYGYASSSAVQITNQTGCELTVRYSGPDAEIIEIPIGSTRTINLPSGTYRITASACGVNYAGAEELHGQYTSRFFIRSTRY